MFPGSGETKSSYLIEGHLSQESLRGTAGQEVFLDFSGADTLQRRPVGSGGVHHTSEYNSITFIIISPYYDLLGITVGR